MYNLPGSIWIRMSLSRLGSDDGTIATIDANTEDKDKDKDDNDNKEGGGDDW